MGTYAGVIFGLERIRQVAKSCFLSYAIEDQRAGDFAERLRQDKYGHYHVPLPVGNGGAAALEAAPLMRATDRLLLILSEHSIVARERIHWLVQAIQDKEDCLGCDDLLWLLPLDDVLQTSGAWKYMFGARPVIVR